MGDVGEARAAVGVVRGGGGGGGGVGEEAEDMFRVHIVRAQQQRNADAFGMQAVEEPVFESGDVLLIVKRKT